MVLRVRQAQIRSYSSDSPDTGYNTGLITYRLAVIPWALVCAGILSASENQAQSSKKEPAARAAGSPMRAAAQRNENVPVYQIDNNAIKEANIRLGSSITFISEAAVERSYFGSEFGRPPSAAVVPARVDAAPGWHAEAYQWHQNSVLNSRTFFQVGGVKPSRRNHYGGRVAANAGDRTYFSADGWQRKIRGMVNGNVLVPLASERRPRATDRAVYAEVARFLAAFPAELPNRPDFDPRALNTNAPQRIDQTDGTLRVERSVAASGRLTLFYNLSRLREDAFQFVAGMNPDTEIHTHRAQAAYRFAPGARTAAELGLLFQRTRSVLQPEPNAVGPRVRFGFQIQELGPDAEFPVDRALNTFRGGGHIANRAGGGHTLTFGADLTRTQLNSIETNDQRGYYYFGNNFGRTAIENFLHGTPSFYAVTLGYLPRGFRNWSGNGYIADRWQARPGLTVYYGLRYSFLTRPVEVNGLDELPYGCDCNNLSPRLALAWEGPWRWVARASYAVSFGEIPPVTYQQIRNNLPLIRYVQVQNPDLLDPLRQVDLNDRQGRAVPTFISPELVSPYAHQYGLSLERRLARETTLRLGYVGSRSVKLLNAYIMNRAEPRPGELPTLDTVDERRPDPRYFETIHVVNGGLGYFNAGQVRVETAPAPGLRAGMTYTFSKAIDDGVDYTGTAAKRDLTRGRSQWQYASLEDKRGLSNFDTPHSFLLTYSWELPAPAPAGGRWGFLLNGWQVAGAVLAKTGTPFTLYVGSDAPGFGNVDGGPGDRPNIVDPSILGATIGHPDTARSILRRDRFAYIRPGEHRGSAPRNGFRKAPIRNWNASVSKVWALGGNHERAVMFRAEVYNLTNTPQFDEPQRNLSSPSFGQITNTLNDGRIFQLGLRLLL